MNHDTWISLPFPMALPELPDLGSLRILVLAPHPDDFDGSGVALKFLVGGGHRVEVAVARTGSGVEDAYRPGLSLAGKADLREEEQRRSLRFFGLSESSVAFLDLENDAEDQLRDTASNRAAIESLLRRAAPDLVLLPHGHDSNTAHQAMHAMVCEAARRIGCFLVLLLARDPKTIAMRVDLYMPFGSVEAEWKARLLRFHDTQQQRNLRTRGHGFDDRMLDLDRRTAREISLAQPYAEAFEVEVMNAID